MFINKKAVKNLIKESGKQVSAKYLESLDGKVKYIVLKSIANARHFKRITEGELN